jgi:F420-non-reducing hydrogenase small subunit
VADASQAAPRELKRFAVLQLSGCAGCEVSLLNASAWVERYRLVYMPLVITSYDVPPVDVLLVSGGVRTDEDLYSLRRAAQHTRELVAVGTCAISGGVASLGNRDEVRAIFLAQAERRHVPRLLPRCRPIDDVTEVSRYLPGCPPTPELFMQVLSEEPSFTASRIVCQECKRQKVKDVRPAHLIGFQQGRVQPVLCLINQGYLCIGSSTRGGCRAPCPRAGHPCVGCRGPSDVLIERASAEWIASIKRVFAGLTDIPPDEVDLALRSPQMALFLFQFSDYSRVGRPPRPKERVL